jgi:hypothetical protein
VSAHEAGEAIDARGMRPLHREDPRKVRNQVSSFGFTIDGPLKGYKASVAAVFKKDPMAKLPQLAAFKERVIWTAIAAGWRHREPTASAPVRLSVVVNWHGAPRIDWKNVYGLIEDALWPQDRYVLPGRHSDVKYESTEPEHAYVVIEDGLVQAENK